MGKYQAYPEYKDSGVEWIGNYPSDWHLTRIKFESYVKARVGWHGLKSDDFTDEGPYLVTGSDFRGPVIQWENCYHCDLSRYEQDPYIQLKEGDLLITKDGTIGKVALVSELDGLATLNSGVFVVRPLFNNYISRFYFWLLQSSVFTGFVDFNKTGSTIVHLYQDTFVNFKFAMPDFDAQEKIANFLDHETAKIDALIAKQQQLIQLLKEKRQAVISHAVTKGLNPNAPMKDSGIEWLGEVPAHWDVKRLKNVAEIIDCRNKTPDYIDDGEYLVVRTTNVKNQRLNFEGALYTDKKNFDIWTARGIPPPGSILFTREAPAGEVCLVPDEIKLCMGQRMMNFITHSQDYQTYLFNFLMSDYLGHYIRGVSHGSTVSHLRVEQVENIPVLVPSPDELIGISEAVARIKNSFLALIEKSDAAIDLLTERRTALISAAVTGKIDVRNFVEPAPR